MAAHKLTAVQQRYLFDLLKRGWDNQRIADRVSSKYDMSLSYVTVIHYRRKLENDGVIAGSPRATKKPRTLSASKTPELYLSVTEDEQKILSLLASQSFHVDEICRECQMPIAQVTGLMAIMEINGLVINIGSMTYQLPKPKRVKRAA